MSTRDQAKYRTRKNPVTRAKLREATTREPRVSKVEQRENLKARKPKVAKVVTAEQTIEAVAVGIASRLNAEWPADQRGEWPDGGWAQIRGTAIRLCYEAFARAYGMRVSPLALAWPECAPLFASIVDDLCSALPLDTYTPEHFGHFHETLVGYTLRDGEVIQSNGRRKSGAHFTPSSLADKVTHTTLDPLLKCIGDQSPLVLRICDPAVGAGAFLLSAIRYLAPLVLIRGDAATLIEAKRLVALHCMRGVDKDRYGVLASRLAVTLECRADRMPADWLDENVKHGDALVGLDQQQITAFHWKREKEASPLIAELYKQAINQAVAEREARDARLDALARSA